MASNFWAIKIKKRRMAALGVDAIFYGVSLA
jgi:hypothetical protein